MSYLQYSIIFAVIRPEISEQISVGLIIVDNNKTDVRVSRNKIEALKGLFPEKEQKFISRVMGSIEKNNSINSVDVVNYLSRYSNNLITVSPLQSIEIEPTDKNKDWLYRNYVYSGK